MITYSLIMSKTEVKPITVRVVDLQETETVQSATITHTPPSNGTATTVATTIDSPYINCTFGPLTTPGIHYIKVQALGSLGSQPEVLYTVMVRDA